MRYPCVFCSISGSFTQLSLCLPAADPLKLDAFDLAILDILQRDNTTPQREIAQAVHLSARLCSGASGACARAGGAAEAANSTPACWGARSRCWWKVHVHDEHPLRTAGLRQLVRNEPAVQQCYAITGEADYLLVITASTMADYEALTGRLFGGDDNVRRFRTSVALGCLKGRPAVPLDRCGPVA